MDAPRQLGRNVRAARDGVGLSQSRLAAATGMHRTEISLVERGGRDPRLSTIVRIARALGVSAASLLEGVE